MPVPVILAATAIAGVGLSAYGTSQSISAARSQANSSAEIAANQQRQEALRNKAMQLDAHRKQIEAVRLSQRARATALSNASSQGAQFGSGLQGGYGQISGAEQNSLLGIGQGLELGNANFAINADISQQRQNQAYASGQTAFGSGLSSLGGGLVSSMGAIGRLSGGFGTGSNSNYSYQDPGVAAYNSGSSIY